MQTSRKGFDLVVTTFQGGFAFMSKKQLSVVLAILLMIVVMACAQNRREAADKTSASNADGAQSSSQSRCTPLETRRPNAPEQKPTFPEQTRACGVKSDVAFEVTVLAKGLDKP